MRPNSLPSSPICFVPNRCCRRKTLVNGWNAGSSERVQYSCIEPSKVPIWDRPIIGTTNRSIRSEFETSSSGSRFVSACSSARERVVPVGHTATSTSRSNSIGHCRTIVGAVPDSRRSSTSRGRSELTYCGPYHGCLEHCIRRLESVPPVGRLESSSDVPSRVSKPRERRPACGSGTCSQQIRLGILFGSRASGTDGPHSDIAVVFSPSLTSGDVVQDSSF